LRGAKGLAATVAEVPLNLNNYTTISCILKVVIMTKRTPKRNEHDAKDNEETHLAPQTAQSWLTQDFDNLFNQVRRSFEDLMTPIMPWPSLFPRMDTTPTPTLDLEDYGDHYRATVQLTGYSKDAVDVKVNKDTLEIKAEKRTEDEQKNGNFLQRERSYSAFQRSITLPEEVLPNKTESTTKNGILVITLPKKQPKQKESLQKVPVRG
jgi:HSP20 family protein